jgi:hypothetical protein
MNDFQVLMFIPETGEFVDLTKYDVGNVIDREMNQIVGKIFTNNETGKEEFIQLRNGPVRKLPKIPEPGVDDGK